MGSSKTFWAFVGLSICIVLALILFFVSTQNEIAKLLSGSNNLVIIEKKEVSPLPADGNADNAVDSLLKELDDENSATKDLEGDLNLIDDDSQEVDDFGQSINEDDF